LSWPQLYYRSPAGLHATGLPQPLGAFVFRGSLPSGLCLPSLLTVPESARFFFCFNAFLRSQDYYVLFFFRPLGCRRPFWGSLLRPRRCLNSFADPPARCCFAIFCLARLAIGQQTGHSPLFQCCAQGSLRALSVRPTWCVFFLRWMEPLVCQEVPHVCRGFLRTLFPIRRMDLAPTTFRVHLTR